MLNENKTQQNSYRLEKVFVSSQDNMKTCEFKEGQTIATTDGVSSHSSHYKNFCRLGDGAA
jgi:hypothetical protein